MRDIRGNEIAMIFQEPMTSLNPVYTIGDQIIEAIVLHQQLKPREARTKADRDAPRGRHPRPRSSAWTPTRTSFPAGCASGS